MIRDAVLPPVCVPAAQESAKRPSLFWCGHCHHEWVQYPSMMTMAMETVVAEKQKKMGIMESSDGVHTAVVVEYRICFE